MAALDGSAAVELDPSVLRYGALVVLRSALPPAGHVRLLERGPPGGSEPRDSEGAMALGGCGVGHHSEVFVLQNSAYRADRGHVTFSDTVRVREVPSSSPVRCRVAPALPHRLPRLRCRCFFDPLSRASTLDATLHRGAWHRCRRRRCRRCR
jgi:hypothetical protein